ncbi:MAG TPA: hypothetical protein DEH25_01595 [Chloroflexi bacterium]|nr:hypothetical protein [Chloroflexota bacterium]
MKKRSRLSIKSDLGLQILALYSLFIVPIVVVALLFDNIAGKRLVQEIQSNDLALARAIAQETDSALSISLFAVEQLSTQPAVIAAAPTGMPQIFEQAYNLRPDVNLVYRLDENGTMVYHYPESPGSTVGNDFSFREYFQRALETRDPLVSLGRISPTTNQPVATAIMPIWEADQFLGVVGTNLKLQSLSDTLAAISTEYHPEEQFQIAILDAGGNVIASPNPAQILTDFATVAPGVAQALLGGEDGSQVEVSEQGEETLYSYVLVPGVGWGVVIARPSSVAFATPQNFHRGVLWMIAVFLGIGIFFWFALSLRVIRPVERLADYSRFMGGGLPMETGDVELLDRFSTRPDQIGHLIRSFKRMEVAIKARIEELGTLLETGAAVVSTLDSQVVLERILEQVERLLGVKQSIIVALDPERDVFRARASRGMSERYARSLEISPDEPTSVTMRAIRVGEPIQVRDTESDPSFAALRPRARAEGYRSMVAIPLKTTHAPASALIVYSPTPQVFNARELNLLSNFANQAAMAIENAELYARSDTRLQEQTRRLVALMQSLDLGLVLEDLDGKILYANRMVSELSGQPMEEIIGQPAQNWWQQITARVVEKTEGGKESEGKLEQLLAGTMQESCILPLQYAENLCYVRVKGFTVYDEARVELGRGQILQDITNDYELDRMKSSLVSTVSHELRTPLAAIKGYVTTLLADDVDWEVTRQQEFLSVILRETDRLTETVNNLLDMSRIEAGSLTLSQTACTLDDIILSAVEHVNRYLGRQVEIEIAPDLPLVHVDADCIEVVVRNLTENALKYSPDDQPVAVSASQVGDWVIVAVEDRGIGIPPDKAEDIFERFYRLENGLTRRKPGVGLGLAISRGFVQAHGGKIWIEPRSVGTRILFSIPIVDVEQLEKILHE